MMDRKKIIEEYLFEGTPEEKKEKFEIAWDVRESFDSIRSGQSKTKVFEPLASRIEKDLLEEPFKITYLDWGSVYVAKREWRQDEKDRGIYAICVEKWNRGWPTIGIVRNKPFTTDTEKQIGDILSRQNFRPTQWYLGYIPIPDWNYGDLRDYYRIVLLNPLEIVDFFFNYFKQVYEIVRKTPGLEQLLDRSVEERKAQVQK
ncbi:hypothetical protein [Hydrogenivirga sp. 128-5-R1-1]|uniref:hypothetical protein n=1 Tax=Hydrogenivirga sp. 128-5-R1-1 TaxID=392423 RepID=UPI000516D9FB|nr:hypothetical protein [Hydrogenivirga sp. 128-5-R1-1]